MPGSQKKYLKPMHPIRRGWTMLFAILFGASQAFAFGRKPDNDRDRFPDYNRLETRSQPAVQASSPTPTSETPSTTMPSEKSRKTAPAGDDNVFVPKPPPKAVPMANSEDSEPPFELPTDVHASTSAAPIP
jgi:hypothetical protein